MAGVRDRDDAEPEGFGEIVPEDFLPRSRIPTADRRLGIDQWTGDAGLIAFAASLDRRKPAHVLAAWFLLAVMLLPSMAVVWFVVHG